jgi:hypothetical protein
MHKLTQTSNLPPQYFVVIFLILNKKEPFGIALRRNN